MRPSRRALDELRSIQIDLGVSKHAEGSALVRFGDTHVLCTASVDEKIPPFLKNTGKGWITAEYGMLPRSTHIRTDREATRGKQSGRTLEIQRLVGRSLRAVTRLESLGERQIKLDCDVLQADGGTRTAAITGSFVALYQALRRLRQAKSLSCIPLLDQVAAISCGLHQGQPILDLDYNEDSKADVDANFVLTGQGKIVEIQSTAEMSAFSEEQFFEMLKLARRGILRLHKLQRAVLNLDADCPFSLNSQEDDKGTSAPISSVPPSYPGASSVSTTS